MSGVEFKVVYEGPDVIFAQLDNLVVHIWRSEVAAEDLKAFREFRQKIDPQYPQGVGGLVLMCDGMKLPSSDAREEGVKLARAIDRTTRSMAIVTEKKGLLSTAFRTAVQTVGLLARSNYPNKFFGNLREGVRWMLKEAERTDLDADAVLEAIQRLRDQMLSGVVAQTAAARG